ncbi:hypothetical protein EV702DRAFT_1233957, partial [Suillus placidus]
KADELAQEQDHNDSDIFLQSPFRSPLIVHRLYPISHPKPIKPIMLDDDEATLFLSSSSAVPSPFFHHTSTQPLLTPVKDFYCTVLAVKQLNSQPAHHVGIGTKRKLAQSGGGDFSTPLCPVPSTTCTPLSISALKPDPSSGIAFHRLAPLPAPRFTPQPKSKADTDAFVKKQAETMKRLRIQDPDDSDEDWGIIEDRDSDGEPVHRLPALHKCKSRFISLKKSLLINAALVPQKGSSKDEVTEAISPGGHIINSQGPVAPILSSTGALSGWPRISGVDDAHLHSFNQSHPYQYSNHDEDDVDTFILCTLEAGGSVLLLRIRSSAEVIRPHVSLVTHSTRDMLPFVLPESWSTALSAAEMPPSSVDPIPLSVYVVKGPKKSGKSTFAWTLLNRLLVRFQHVAYLECDVGQSEFTPGGLVALNVIDNPVFGPPFMHPSLPYRAHYVGATSPRCSPAHYLAAIQALLETFKLEVQTSLPDDKLIDNFTPARYSSGRSP